MPLNRGQIHAKVPNILKHTPVTDGGRRGAAGCGGEAPGTFWESEGKGLAEWNLSNISAMPSACGDSKLLPHTLWLCLYKYFVPRTLTVPQLAAFTVFGAGGATPATREPIHVQDRFATSLEGKNRSMLHSVDCAAPHPLLA